MVAVFGFVFFLVLSFFVASCSNAYKVSSQEVSPALSARLDQLRSKARRRVEKINCKGNTKCERDLSLALGDQVACLEKADNSQLPPHQVVEGSIQCMEKLNKYLDTFDEREKT